MKITQDSILKARQWFLDNTQVCIEEAVSGDVRVNDLGDYIESMLQRMEDIEAGLWDNTFTFKQRAWFIQTGECVALLP